MLFDLFKFVYSTHSTICAYVLTPILFIILAAHGVVRARQALASKIDPKDKVIVVTGAASGIGRQLTLDLIEAGSFIVALDINETQLNKEFGSNSSVMCMKCNVTDTEEVNACIKKVTAAGKSIYGLVNNAGIPGASVPLSYMPISQLNTVMQINVLGAARLVQACKHDLVKNSGIIVNISSMASLGAFPFSGPYCASKIALEYISDVYRREFSIYAPACSDKSLPPVRSCAVHPWFAPTNIYQAATDLSKEIKFTGDDSKNKSQLEYLEKKGKSIAQNSKKLTMITVEEITQCISTALFSSNPRSDYYLAKPLTLWTLPFLFDFAPKWMTDLFLTEAEKRQLLNQKGGDTKKTQ